MLTISSLFSSQPSQVILRSPAWGRTHVLISILIKWKQQLYQSRGPNGVRSVKQQGSVNSELPASAGSSVVHIPSKHILVHRVSHCSNCQLPCAQTVGETVQPRSKSKQFFWHARSRQSKDIPVKYIFIDIYWQVCLPRVAANPHLHFLLLSKTYPASEPPVWAHSTGTIVLQASSQHIPASAGSDASPMRQFQENESAALSFLSIFVISSSRSWSRNQLPYQSDMYTKPRLKDLLLQCYLIDTRLLPLWTSHQAI